MAGYQRPLSSISDPVAKEGRKRAGLSYDFSAKTSRTFVFANRPRHKSENGPGSVTN